MSYEVDFLHVDKHKGFRRFGEFNESISPKLLSWSWKGEYKGSRIAYWTPGLGWKSPIK